MFEGIVGRRHPEVCGGTLVGEFYVCVRGCRSKRAILLRHDLGGGLFAARQTVREADLTPPQYAVLNMLWDQDGRPFKEFAVALVCTRATITGIIDTLERKGLVVRKPNPEDRRSLLATLTEAGSALQQKTPSLETTYNSCCSGLSPLEFQQLAFLLHKLNDSLICPEVK